MKHRTPHNNRIKKRSLTKYLHTITFDNGTEFSAHKYIAEELSVEVYFARPYCSNDRARNENTSGLLRDITFPKRLVLVEFLKSNCKGLLKI
jgi:IS30 family transposase